MLIRLFIMGLVLFAAGGVYAANMDDYATPDSWSKNITANGVKASSGSIDLGKGGSLSLGLTTRYQIGRASCRERV